MPVSSRAIVYHTHGVVYHTLFGPGETEFTAAPQPRSGISVRRWIWTSTKFSTWRNRFPWRSGWRCLPGSVLTRASGPSWPHCCGCKRSRVFFDYAIQGVAHSLRCSREPSPGDIVGSYRLVSLIGQGGMGSVYLASRADGEIEQRVAIKLLRADSLRTEWRERFLKERQLLGIPAPPFRRPRNRCRTYGRRAAISGDGARRGRAHRPLRGRHRCEGAAEAVPACVRRRIACAPAPDHSSRSETVQHPGGRRRATRSCWISASPSRSTKPAT